jgi:hypothetical protein
MGFSWNVSPLALNWALLMPAKFKVAWLVVADKAKPAAKAAIVSLCFIGMLAGLYFLFRFLF